MINSCPKTHCHRPFIKINIHASVKVAISSLFYITLEGNYPNPSPCQVLNCVCSFGILPSILIPRDPMSSAQPWFPFSRMLIIPFSPVRDSQLRLCWCRTIMTVTSPQKSGHFFLLEYNMEISPKGNQPWIFIGRTDVEAETPILWQLVGKNWLIGKDPDAGKDWRREEKGTTEDEMVGWHHRLSKHEFEQTPGHGEGQGSLACCSPWGHEESDTTEQLNLLKDPWMLFCEAIVHLFWMFSSIPQNKYAPNYLLFRLLMLIDTGLVSVFLLL